MRTRALAAVLSATGLLLTGCAAGGAAAAEPPVGHAELTLVGEWVGGSSAGEIRMTVEHAAEDGSAFDGVLREGSASASSPLHAEMTPNGHLVAEVGGDVSLELHIVDPGTLDYCLMAYGSAPDYSCGRLERQS